jgi:hypothetical protein
MSNETFLSQLQSIIGKTLRQIQLHTGEMKEILRMVAKWLISARKALYEGKRMSAESDMRIALKVLRIGRANTIA